MLGTVLISLHILTHLILTTKLQVFTIIILILQMKETEAQNDACSRRGEALSFKGLSAQLPLPVSAFKVCLSYLTRGQGLSRETCMG